MSDFTLTHEEIMDALIATAAIKYDINAGEDGFIDGMVRVSMHTDSKLSAEVVFRDGSSEYADRARSNFRVIQGEKD
jgi:hypothetical protein